MHFAEMRKYTIKFVLFNIFFKLPVFDIFVVQTMVIPYHTSAGMECWPFSERTNSKLFPGYDVPGIQVERRNENVKS